MSKIKTTPFEKTLYSGIINQAYELCKEFIDTGHIKLNPGTYTAMDIHQYLLNKFRKSLPLLKNKIKDTQSLFISRNDREGEIWRKQGSDPKDIRSIKEVTSEGLTIREPWRNMFHVLASYEKLAGVTGGKKHTFTIHETKCPVATATITFPKKKSMRVMSRIVKKHNVKGNKNWWLSPSSGVINIPSSRYSYEFFENQKPRKFIDEYSNDVFQLNMCSCGEEFNNLSFRLTAENMKHLYNECVVSLYIDSDDTHESTMHIVIENSDGWIVSTDIVKPITEGTVEECANSGLENKTSGREFYDDVLSNDNESNAGNNIVKNAINLKIPEYDGLNMILSSSDERYLLPPSKRKRHLDEYIVYSVAKRPKIPFTEKYESEI